MDAIWLSMFTLLFYLEAVGSNYAITLYLDSYLTTTQSYKKNNGITFVTAIFQEAVNDGKERTFGYCCAYLTN